MHTNFLRLNFRNILILPALLVFALLSLAEAEPFSFDKALQMYNDVKTASQLLDYLQSASANDQKDYRYTLYMIRCYYAEHQFLQGDALIESGLVAAAKAGLTDADTLQIRTDLKKEKVFWEMRSQSAVKANSGGASTTKESHDQR
jgi:hypothetical protein